jgi:hypothetical protein
LQPSSAAAVKLLPLGARPVVSYSAFQPPMVTSIFRVQPNTGAGSRSTTYTQRMQDDAGHGQISCRCTVWHRGSRVSALWPSQDALITDCRCSCGPGRRTAAQVQCSARVRSEPGPPSCTRAACGLLLLLSCAACGALCVHAACRRKLPEHCLHVMP